MDNYNISQVEEVFMNWFKIHNSKPGHIMSAQHYLNYKIENLSKIDKEIIKIAINELIHKGFLRLNQSQNFVLTQKGYEYITST